jgi:protein-S-isoprenylcysteine O-methyltransferase Ste14
MNMSFTRLFLAAAHLAGMLFFCLFLYGAYNDFLNTSSIRSLALVLVNFVFLSLYFLRKEPKLVSSFPFAWAMSFTGTILPVFLRPTGSELFPDLSGLGLTIQLAGIFLIVVSLLFLRQSFGIVPANRGIQQGGLYRIIRHPLYASELISFLGYVLSYPSLMNILLLLLEAGIQYSRARMEENLLLGDPVYREYAARTRYRFFPGLL